MKTKKASVLVVEDEIVLQDAYKLILESAGFQVHTASNGAKALSMVKDISPKLILLDIFMPVLDGRDFLKNLNKSELPDTKIIVFSNLSDSETQNDVLELGADGFILKSNIGPRDLINLASEHAT